MLNENKTSDEFLSANFWRNADNEHSSFLTVALMGLPLKAPSHDYKSKGRGIDITAASSLLIFKKEVRETELEIKNDIMATHRYVLTNRSGGDL